ncbi:DUF4367 domain-containing protein [Thalassobacillus sp. CUG 92003]|uniref:DUF4367 domain-containing protein n=1 Tax=Thalassobacillus sp. CUG 92003 TaxID=2736641 RepID=UPI0015E7C37F
MGEEDVHISLEVAHADVNLSSQTDIEEVGIDGETGDYFENEQDARFLVWEVEGVNYLMSTRREIGKEALISTAESFQ